MIDPAYKVVGLMWAKDLAETVLMILIVYPILRRVVKKYLLDLKCPHCGQNFGSESGSLPKENLTSTRRGLSGESYVAGAICSCGDTLGDIDPRCPVHFPSKAAI
jgi:hypothetical protein